MAKEKFNRSKPHVNVGTIGHIDHGKTTLTAALVKVQSKKNLAKVISYADIAKFIQERLGITASRGQVYRAYQIWLEESRQAEEGIAQEERYAPEPTFQEEYEHRLYESAVALIDELRDRHAQGSNEPWTDPETLLGRAHGILAEERRLAEKAEAEAADADLLLEAKKGKKDASAK